mmetsp:Transcript_62672/g.123909  ORF Transcript_62672/g.123909 Transcript_62672/m.123909 type:complete len:89 (+) Transcript_62672:113-379(+)
MRPRGLCMPRLGETGPTARGSLQGPVVIVDITHFGRQRRALMFFITGQLLYCDGDCKFLSGPASPFGGRKSSIDVCPPPKPCLFKFAG